MSGPYAFSRQMQAVEALLQAAPTFEGLEQAFAPAMVADRFDPGEDLKKLLFAFSNTAEGRKIVEWLADLTVRAPYPSTGATLEAAAIAAAKHEARAAVGYSILRAIAEGQELLTQRSQTDA